MTNDQAICSKCWMQLKKMILKIPSRFSSTGTEMVVEAEDLGYSTAVENNNTIFLNCSHNTIDSVDTHDDDLTRVHSTSLHTTGQLTHQIRHTS